MKSLLLCALLLFGLCAAAPARAAEGEAFARVVVAETELRSGPGVAHRVISRARRGESFVIEQRETSGFWLQILLPDGRTAYVLGDTIEVVNVDEEAEGGFSRPGLFAPPALQEARGGFALLGGAYDLDGYGEVRPALVLAPAIALEPYIGVALQRDGRRLVYGLAGTLNLMPDWAIAPYVTLGVGRVDENPKDEFVREDRSWFHARAGGGLLVSLRLRILLRLEATNIVLFTEDDYENVQSYIGGLGTYF